MSKHCPHCGKFIKEDDSEFSIEGEVDLGSNITCVVALLILVASIIVLIIVTQER